MQVVVLLSFGVPMVSVSPPHSDALGSLGDVLMIATKLTAVCLLDTCIFIHCNGLSVGCSDGSDEINCSTFARHVYFL